MQIIQYPHPTLRHVSKPLKRVDQELHAIVREMFDLMYAANGVGLAANQVDLPYRLFIINLKSDPAAKDEELVFINPVLTSRKGNAEAEEGCLSLPGLVRRREAPRAGRAQCLRPGRPGSEHGARRPVRPGRAARDRPLGRHVVHRPAQPDRARWISRTRSIDFDVQFAGQRERGEIPDDATIARRLAELEKLRT